MKTDDKLFVVTTLDTGAWKHLREFPMESMQIVHIDQIELVVKSVRKKFGIKGR